MMKVEKNMIYLILYNCVATNEVALLTMSLIRW